MARLRFRKLQWVGASPTGDCLFESIERTHRCAALKIPARVLIFRLSKTLSHAVCVYFPRTAAGSRALVFDSAKRVSTILPASITETSTPQQITHHLIAGAAECWWFEDTP